MTSEQHDFWAAIIQIIPVLAIAYVLEARSGFGRNLRRSAKSVQHPLVVRYIGLPAVVLLAIAAAASELYGLLVLNLSETSRLIQRSIGGSTTTYDPNYPGHYKPFPDIHGTLLGMLDPASVVAIVTITALVVFVFIAPVTSSMWRVVDALDVAYDDELEDAGKKKGDEQVAP